MKVDYLPDLMDGGKYEQVVSEKLVRLYDFDHREAIKFRQALQETIVDKQSPLDVTLLPFVDAINCKLIFAISDEDKGVETEDGFLLICGLTIKAYKNMIYLLEPFCEVNDRGGYQWLYEPYDVESDIDLLLSPGGTW
jgi:hypothetical protein